MGARQDKIYRRFAEDGDYEGCRRILDSLALSSMRGSDLIVSGRPIVLHHSTNRMFNVFKPSSSGWFGGGVYFSVSKDGFPIGKRVLPCYVNARKLATMDDLVEELGDPDMEVDVGDFSRNREFLQGLGYDGFLGDVHGTTLAYWGDVSNIKLAKPTWSDDGELIPLSMRFDFSNPDIRY